MSTLKYKTRGMSNPRGKQKVFFTSHPEDLDIYFEKISDLILKYQNCAIWYAEDGNAEEADILGMQLYVIPVTKKFLDEENQARSRNIELANANHIPVLPIITEEGLEIEFNHRCGDIQGIPLENRDATALPSEEKLKKFLNSVLVGDELAEEIRKAFAAYIFMSYRKMDRGCAQDLMKLIHKNEECRDIAIWYDEFLNPGENFNDEIKDAMEKSGLFALVITPNLINSKYIKETEYPKALELDMPILPTQMTSMETSDWDELKADDVFCKLPEIIEGIDSDVFRRSLLKAVKGMRKKKFDTNEVEHDFLMGLAYLSGVDVEVDHEKAVTLIMKSANAEYEKALLKLSDMYQNGEGVKRDYVESAKRLEELAEIQEKRLAVEESEQKLDDLFDTYFNCGEKWFHMGKTQEAEKFFVKANAPGLVLHQKYYSITREQKFMVLFHYLGEISYAEGKVEDALDWYKSLLEIGERLVKEAPTMTNLLNCLSGCLEIGHVISDLGQFDEARKWYVKAHDLCEKIPDAEDDYSKRHTRALVCGHLGDIFEKCDEIKLAYDQYERAMEIWEQLAQEQTDVDFHKYISANYHCVGRTLSRLGEVEKTKQLYQKKLEYDLEWVQNSGTVASKRELAVAYHNMGKVCEQEKDFNQAISWYDEMLRVDESLEKETDFLSAKREVSMAYLSLGACYHKMGDFNKSKEMLARGIVFAKEVYERVSEDPRKRTIECISDLLVLYERLGAVCLSENNYLGAETWYSEVVKLRSQMVNLVSTAEYVRCLLNDMYKLIKCSITNMHLEDAKQYSHHQLQIANMLYDEYDDEWVCLELAKAFMLAVEILTKTEEFEEALLQCEEWEKLGQYAFKKFKSRDCMGILYLAYINKGAINARVKIFDMAIAYYEKSIALLNANKPIDGKLLKEHAALLFECYNQISNFYYELGNLEQSMSYKKEAIFIKSLYQ